MGLTGKLGSVGGDVSKPAGYAVCDGNTLSCRRSRRILFSTRFFFLSFFLYTGAFTCACILFFYGSSFLYRRIHMRLYSVFLWFFFLLLLLLLSTIKPDVPSSCFDRFQWNLVTMIKDPARICHMTLDRVKGHPRSRGSKRLFSPKTHQVLRIMQHGPVTYLWSSPWPTLQMLLDHFFIWGHLGSQGSNIRSESKYL